MDKTAGAVADLRISLEVTASTYAEFARREDVQSVGGLLEELAAERRRDASDLAHAAISADLALVNPTLDRQTAAEFVGLGRSEPSSGSSVAFRVQRAENSLARFATQLRTSTPYGAVRAALSGIQQRISSKRDEVREFRAQMNRLEASAGRAESSPRSLSGASAAPGEEVVVWFGTNRARNSAGKFIAERGGSIHYGKCRVFVPEGRSLGSLGSGLLGRLARGDDRVKLTGTDVVPEAEYWSQLSDACRGLDAGDRQALVFLHGYWTKFEDAARRAGQLKADLQHRGPAAFFSWPSLGREYGYTGDEAAIEGSEAAIRTFLTDFATRSGAQAVHVIAHSMGNRALLRAVDSIAKEAQAKSRVRFGQLILAAPDVDTDLFQDLASSYAALAERSTLYVAENDRAVGLSRFVHGAPRVGRAPPVVVVPGIDTINVSQVNLGLIGHGYAAELRPVLADMHALIASNTPPEKRFGLSASGAAGNEHWIFKR